MSAAQPDSFSRGGHEGAMRRDAKAHRSVYSPTSTISTSRKGGVLPDHVVDLADAAALRQKYSQYKKVMSIAQLSRLGLPVLPGYVIDKLDAQVLGFLRDWAASNGARRLSLRFDSTSATDHMRLMGSNPTLGDLAEMGSLVHPPVIAIVMAENDRFAQSYSVLATFERDELTCEVVGPGFDASDLTRGQISPHERFVLVRKARLYTPTLEDGIVADYRELRPSDILSHTICSREQYRESLGHRYAKIYAILQRGLGHAVNGHPITATDRSQVDLFLEARGAALPSAYEPIGRDQSKLTNLYHYLADLDVFQDEYVMGKTLSSSFLRRHGLVFWDLYGSDKYNLPG